MKLAPGHLDSLKKADQKAYCAYYGGHEKRLLPGNWAPVGGVALIMPGAGVESRFGEHAD